MSQAVDHGDGRLVLSGRLTSATVPALEEQGRELLTTQGSHYVVDLKDVSFGSSAGVALLLAWLRTAKAVDAKISFKNLPSGMQGLIRVSNLEDILPVDDVASDSL